MPESITMGEDWRTAPGVRAKPTDKKADLARRDYSVRCAPTREILSVDGYLILWCSAHHQPLAQCDLGRVATGFLSIAEREAINTVIQERMAGDIVAFFRDACGMTNRKAHAMARALREGMKKL